MSHEFQFGDFRLDTDEECLYRADQKLNLNRRNIQVLRLLIERQGQIVTKSEFFETIWADTFVEEANLSVAIASIRKALGDDPKQPAFIENLPRKGYRFIADVNRIEKNGNGFYPTGSISTPDKFAEADTETRAEIALSKSFALRHKTAIAAVSIMLLAMVIGFGYRNFALGGSRDLSIPNDLAVDLTEKERTYIVAHGTRDREAYLHYLRGRYYWDRREEKTADSYYDKAVDEFKAAIDRDPTFALPYTGIANALGQMSVGSKYALPSQERYRVITAYLRKAIEIDPTLSEAHASLGMNELFLAPKPQWDIAGQEYRKAVELDPANAQARHWLAEYLAITGKFDESLAEYDKAIELDPLSIALRGDKCYAFMFAHLNNEAITCIDDVRHLDPSFRRTYWYAFIIYSVAGKLKESLDIWLLVDYGENTDLAKEYEPKMRYALESEGEIGYWRTYLEYASNFGGPGQPMAFAKLGDKDRAFIAIDKWIDSQAGGLAYIKVWPFFDNLHSDPRWEQMLVKIGFKPKNDISMSDDLQTPIDSSSSMR